VAIESANIRKSCLFIKNGKLGLGGLPLAANDTSLRSLSRLARLGSEAAWTFLGQAGIAAGAIFAVKILTLYLEPAQFGRLMLATTLIQAVAAQVYGPLAQGVMRFWSLSQQRGQQEEFVHSSWRMSTILTRAMLVVTLLAVGGVFFFEGRQWSLLVGLSLLVGIFTGQSWTRMLALMAARERKAIAIVTTGIAFLKPLSGIGLILLFSPDANWVLLGYLGAAFAGLIVIDRIYQKRITGGLRSTGEMSGLEKRNLGKDLFSFSWPFFVYGVFSWLYESCDRWSLQYHFGSEVVGAFSVAGQLAMYPLILISGFLGMLFSPIAYQRAGALDSGKALRAGNRLLFFMALIYVACCGCLIAGYALIHEQIVLLVSGSSYTAFSYLLPGLTAAWSLYYFGHTLTSFGMLANRPKLYILPKFIATGIAAVFSIVLPLWYGPEGVAWALGTAGFVYAAWCLVIACRLSRSWPLPLSPRG